MENLAGSINSFPPVCATISPQFAPVLASLRAADTNRVVAACHLFFVAFLQTVGSVVPALLAALHTRSAFLCQDEYWTGNRRSDRETSQQETATGCIERVHSCDDLDRN